MMETNWINSALEVLRRALRMAAEWGLAPGARRSNAQGSDPPRAGGYK